VKKRLARQKLTDALGKGEPRLVRDRGRERSKHKTTEEEGNQRETKWQEEMVDPGKKTDRQ